MEDKKNTFQLNDIPLNSCKLITYKDKKLAVCHEPNGKFKLYELKPIGFKKEKISNQN